MTFSGSYQIIFTLSESYNQTRVNPFSEFTSTILTLSGSYTQTTLHNFPDINLISRMVEYLFTNEVIVGLSLVAFT